MFHARRERLIKWSLVPLTLMLPPPLGVQQEPRLPHPAADTLACLALEEPFVKYQTGNGLQ